MWIAILGVVTLSLFLYVTRLLTLFTPVPLMILSIQRGFWVSVIAFFLSLSTLFILYHLKTLGVFHLPFLSPMGSDLSHVQTLGLSLLSFFYYGLMGLTIAYFSQRDLSLEGSVLRILGITLLVPAILLIGFAKITHLDLIHQWQIEFGGVFADINSLQTQAGLSPEDLEAIKSLAPRLIEEMIRLSPSLWIVFTLFMMSMNILFLRRWVLTADSFPGWRDFTLWRLNEKWIWIPILLGSAFFLELYLLPSRHLETVLLNALIVFGAVYFFQGIAIVSFYARRRLPPLFRTFAYMIGLLFLQFFGPIIVALGLFDFWFDFRKPKKVG